jgi:hypothetical protein
MTSLIPFKNLNTSVLKTFENADVLKSCNDEDELRTKLSIAISYLLNHDMERLLNIFYRLDLSETKVKEVIINSSPEKISLELSDLVMEREKQKIITRMKYRED